MRFFSSFATLSVLAVSTLAAVTPLINVERAEGETNGRLIVQLKGDASRADVLKQLGVHNITHEWQHLNGFAGHFSSEAVNALRANPNVKSIHEDGILRAARTQTNAPWGLARLTSSTKLPSTDASALTYSYTYDDSAGSGVDIYIIDSGIRTTHVTFEGRARWGATFGGYPNGDGYGHGTLVAGAAAGSQFGAAKKANLIAVKVLDDSGNGVVSDGMSALDWIKGQVGSTGRPSVVNISMESAVVDAFDKAVTSLVDAGIHVAVAAGNSNTDAGNNSPARARGVVTVGSSSISDVRSSFSNYGSVVSIFAPGEDIISSWISSDTATASESGTSFAAPYVAGLIAYLIARDGNISPAAMSNKLRDLSLKNVLGDIPSGTPNNLAHSA